MKSKRRKLTLMALASSLSLGPAALIEAASTIDPTHPFAYGANIGWVNTLGDGDHGAVVGEYICSGYVWSANVGWIDLGNGSPADGIRYQNNSASDFGVNHDGLGNLRGFAYGANIGWIQFEANGTPRVDLRTGDLSGFVYSANCGWISLSNAFAHVQTGSINPGEDSDGDGISDAWELSRFGDVTIADAVSDFDRDGVSDKQEQLADTDPKDPNDQLRITEYSASAWGLNHTITWTSRPTRQYYILKTDMAAQSGSWVDTGLGLISPDNADTTTRQFNDAAPAHQFFRIQVVTPLAP